MAGCKPIHLFIISIHALCEEGDLLPHPRRQRQQDFYPRPLRGGRLVMRMIAAWSMLFLSTPSARRATRPQHFQGHPTAISIHALCEEGDYGRAGGVLLLDLFLSTPSARRATKYFLGQSQQAQDFYPRPLRGGRRYPRLIKSIIKTKFLSTPSARRATDHNITGSIMTLISIHALCEEGDCKGIFWRRYMPISIHALCEEGDDRADVIHILSVDFYPRPLRGGRPLHLRGQRKG